MANAENYQMEDGSAEGSFQSMGHGTFLHLHPALNLSDKFDIPDGRVDDWHWGDFCCSIASNLVPPALHTPPQAHIRDVRPEIARESSTL